MNEEIIIRPEDLIWDYHKLHQEIYLQYGLTSLSGLDQDFLLNGRNLLEWHHAVTRKCSVKYNGQFYHLKNFDDILFCSEELLYFTASLYLYRPYINNPLQEAFYAGDKILYPNFQNHYGKRYGMFDDVASQCVYNFWDRVGDMIASFFPDKLEPSKVFFPLALDVIPTEFKSSHNYLWLENFRLNEYKQLNEKRKQVVHYTTSETAYKYKHIEKGSTNRVEMEKIQAERESLPDYYKNHIDLTLQGFEKALLLLEEISNSIFSDIP